MKNEISYQTLIHYLTIILLVTLLKLSEYPKESVTIAVTYARYVPAPTLEAVTLFVALDTFDVDCVVVATVVQEEPDFFCNLYVMLILLQ